MAGFFVEAKFVLFRSFSPDITTKIRPIFESWSHYRKMAIFILSGKLVSLTSDDVTVTGERVSGGGCGRVPLSVGVEWRRGERRPESGGNGRQLLSVWDRQEPCYSRRGETDVDEQKTLPQTSPRPRVRCSPGQKTGRVCQDNTHVGFTLQLLMCRY